MRAPARSDAPPPSGAPWDAVVKVGKPYQVLGRWYEPRDDRDYSETGLASWYGPGFHALSTANGEVYDQDGLSAAHKTLPLPSYVEVENLDNGRRLTVRVNDRGPFVDGRILDLSRRAAQLLGVDGPGTARVMVRRVVPDGATLAALRPRAPALAVFAPPPRAATAPAIAATAAVTAATLAVPARASAVVAAPSGVQVQVVAVGDAARAAWLAGYLSRFGPARVETTPGGLHRVRLGPFGTRNEAEAALSQVRGAGYAGAWIVGGAAAPGL